MYSKKIKILLIVSLIFFNVGCDQVSKSIVRESISYYERISVIPNTVTLTKVENTGAFLSLGSNFPPFLKKVFFLSFPVLVLLFALYYIFTQKKLSIWIVAGLSFITGGGIGNLYDRILYGSVTDFLHIDFGLFRTGVFNMADVSIMTGTFLMVIGYYIQHKNQKKAISSS